MSLLRQNKLLVILTLVLGIASCSISGHYGNGDDNFYSAFATFDDAQWEYADAQTFRVDTLSDSIAPSGTLVLTLRHTHGYPYSNIWLELDYAHGDSIQQIDTLNIILADVYGHWQGRGMGSSFQVNDTLQHNMQLRRGQELRVRHIMRVDTLEGIEQIGITYLPD